MKRTAIFLGGVLIGAALTLWPEPRVDAAPPVSEVALLGQGMTGLTQSELLTDLDGKTATVGTPELVAEIGGVKTYDVPVLQTDGDTAIQRIVSYYVVNEGAADEAAYYRQDPDQSTQQARQTMQSAAQEWLNARIGAATGDGTLVRGEPVEVSLSAKFMIVRAFVDIGTGIEIIHYIVPRALDNSGWETHRKVSNYAR